LCDFRVERYGRRSVSGKEGIGDIIGVIERVSSRRWRYHTTPGYRGGPGLAVRRSATVWDVHAGRNAVKSNRIGFVKIVRARGLSPLDAPAAALSLLMLWPDLLRCVR